MLVTFFDSPAAPTKRESDLDLPALRALVLATSAPAKSDLPWLKLARFGDQRSRKGSLRNNVNVIAISGVEGDYDGGYMDPATAVAALDAYGVQALVYTSPSHEPNAPRWRVLCPTSRPLPPAERAGLVARLNGVLGGVLARESFTLSQAYYFGRIGAGAGHAAWIVDGAPIDTLGLTTEIRPQESVALPLPALPGGLAPTEHCRAALDRATALLTAPEAVGQRHQALLTASMLIAPMVKSGHIGYGDAIISLTDAMEASGRVPNDGEVDGALSGALARVQPYIPPTQGEEFDGLTPPTPATQTATATELTEDACALGFAESFADRFRFDVTAGGSAGESIGAWYRFDDGLGWTRDTVNSVYDTARAYVRGQRALRGFPNTAGAGSSGFPAGVIRMARTDPRLACVSAQWDADPWRLGVPGGYVDLRTGVLVPAEPSALLRRRTTVAPSATAECPTWRGFLDTATAGDQDFQAWLQRLAGYMLTGDTSEEIFAFVYGPGGNGKGTFLAALESILGGYAYKAPTELFKADSRINREYQLARLESMRAVFASETERGAFLAEGFVKELTGNEGAINARHIYGAPFEFRPAFKLLIVGNHAPRLSGRTDAMERRMRVVPFNVKPPVPDPTLKERLVSEHRGILRWAIEGCLAWQRSRLGVCGAVGRASAEYFQDQDPVALWVAETCVLDPTARYPATPAAHALNAWLHARREKPLDARAFRAAMERIPGVDYRKSNGVMTMVGIGPAPAHGPTEFQGLLQ